jgi:hypothetical protein
MGEAEKAAAVATLRSPSELEQSVRGKVMDRLREFLEIVQAKGYAVGNFLGLLHVLIGRKISKADGTELSSGLTWREAAGLFKRLRWDREAVRELSLDPDTLPPRDRQLFWFKAIAAAGVASQKATEAGNRLAEEISNAGFLVGPPPNA